MTGRVDMTSVESDRAVDWLLAVRKHGLEKANAMFRPETRQDGRWHSSSSFSTKPIKVHTYGRNGAGVQYHRGAHALVERWTGSRWESDHCGCIHKKRSTTIACSERLARDLNRKLDAASKPTVRMSDLFVSNGGRVSCRLHGGAYFVAHLTAEPTAESFVTPLDAWEKVTGSDRADWLAEMGSPMKCEDCPRNEGEEK